MLSQIVRPLVQTQIRLLANSQATRSTLTETISHWLGYLGVHASVTHLKPFSDQIQISLTVGKPECCEVTDWQKILDNLIRSSQKDDLPTAIYGQINLSQQTKLARLLAYLIQIGTSSEQVDWETIESQLQYLNLDESILLGIKSALKVPQSPDQLLKGLDPDLAAIALPTAVRIALLDRHINQQENSTLTTLLEAMK
jgi:hypothetical protein